MQVKYNFELMLTKLHVSHFTICKNQMQVNSANQLCDRNAF